jgi:DNA-binding MarR family transcriptional regulator
LAEQDSLTSKLIHTARLCRSLRASFLAKHGLYAGQDMLLQQLARSDGQSMGALAEALDVRPPTITKMVARMQAQRLVRREPSKYDSRQNHVHITEAGTALLKRVDAAWRETEECAFAGMKEKDFKRLKKILGKIRTNLDNDSKA